MTTRQTFDKKIYTAGRLASDIGFLLLNSPEIIRAMHNQAISRAFIEKIMTVTTAVNGCVYCAWFHAKQAVASGISETEVQNMLKLQFQADATEFELTGLLYAQHFAETNRRPDPAMTQQLLDDYGAETAQHIILFIRMIFLGNLYGNTWDAVLSRFTGAPAQHSSVLFELAFFLLNAPVMFPTMLLMWRDGGQAELPRPPTPEVEGTK